MYKIHNKKLIKLRIDSGLNQTEVAKKIGVSKQHYNHIELGRRHGSIKVLKKLAKLYGITIDDLLKQDVEKIINKKL